MRWIWKQVCSSFLAWCCRFADVPHRKSTRVSPFRRWWTWKASRTVPIHRWRAIGRTAKTFCRCHRKCTLASAPDYWFFTSSVLCSSSSASVSWWWCSSGQFVVSSFLFNLIWSLFGLNFVSSYRVLTYVHVLLRQLRQRGIGNEMFLFCSRKRHLRQMYDQTTGQIVHYVRTVNPKNQRDDEEAILYRQSTYSEVQWTKWKWATDWSTLACTWNPIRRLLLNSMVNERSTLSISLRIERFTHFFFLELKWNIPKDGRETSCWIHLVKLENSIVICFDLDTICGQKERGREEKICCFFRSHHSRMKQHVEQN